MAESSRKDDIYQISAGLFKTVRDVVGQECIVNLRRQGIYLADSFYNCDTSWKVSRIISGSRSEGFEFPSSDMDSVFVNRNASVWRTSFLSYLHSFRSPTLLYLVSEGVPPGYTLIRCSSCDESDHRVFDALVWRRGVRYVSSYAVREAYMYYKFNHNTRPMSVNANI
ncbi:hypothetical protein FSP39_012611 [Pinctada imbricata]|uniref:Uncharacterized protein n=1 Tax=Pinctada imbricata TaxID=66713 RepID=A0AA88XIM7_PINIB|nr:hypothetical protein FSP39_012611 [Pinctada imbricata]